MYKNKQIIKRKKSILQEQDVKKRRKTKNKQIYT